MGADRTPKALAALDPESRALLELSLLRGLSDEDLAGMLGAEAKRVRERREGLLETLGATSEEEQAQLAARLRGEEPATEVAPPGVPRDDRGAVPATEVAPLGVPRDDRGAVPVESALGEGVPAADVPGDEPSPGRGPRRVVWAVVGGLTIAAVVALGLALGANEDTEGGFTPPEEAAPAEPQRESPVEGPAEPPANLEPLGGGPGRATAQIVVGGPVPTLRLAVRGLPTPDEGGYVVWLYNSVSDARELTGSRRGTFSVTPELPREAAQYRFLDISREPADGNRNHSGASVLRAPIEDVPRASE